MKTDSQLQADVSAELRWDPSVHAAQIGVQVKDGVVTLAGEVSSLAEKWRAERAAQRVWGIKALAVDMVVKLTALGRRTDADIARSVATALAWSNALPADAIQIMVEDGSVTLSGAVDWQYQKEAAANAVRRLVGVTAVRNEIAIHPVAFTGVVQADIEAALRRVSSTDAPSVAVDVNGAEVTLCGTVRDWSERDVVTRAAWRSPGVRNVIDNLTIGH